MTLNCFIDIHSARTAESVGFVSCYLFMIDLFYSSPEFLLHTNHSKSDYHQSKLIILFNHLNKIYLSYFSYR